MAGEDHGFTPSELANIRDGSNQVSYDVRDARTLSTTSGMGMSKVFKGSDTDEGRGKSLVDLDDHACNLQTIREIFSQKAFSFEDVLAHMPSLVSGDMQSKVTFTDFCSVVQTLCVE